MMVERNLHGITASGQRVGQLALLAAARAACREFLWELAEVGGGGVLLVKTTSKAIRSMGEFEKRW